MIAYILMYISSIFFLFLGLSEKKNKKIRITLIAIGLLIPCVFAGIRDVSVGNDTKRYLLSVFDMAKANNIKNFFNYCNWYLDINDYGYLLLSFVITKVFGSFNVLLFFIEVIIVATFYKSVDINKKNKYDVIFSMAIFYLFFYNATFNMIRQSLALTSLLLGIAYLNKDNYKCSIIWLIISILFHKTACVAILIYAVYYFIKKNKLEGVKEKIVIGVIYVITAIAVLNYKNIITFLNYTGIYSHGMLYLKNYAKLDFSFTDTFIYIAIIFGVIFNKKLLVKKKTNYDFYLFLAIEALIILQLGAFVEYLERVSFYFIYPVIFCPIPLICSKIRKIDQRNAVFVVMFFILYWLYIYVFLNSHNTIPFRIS